jgi:4-hydroxy-3-methylbut-2-enyl diphosphate reductase
MNNKPTIIKLPIQSFCFGVRNAIKKTNNVLNEKTSVKPLSMLGEVVHNKYVSEYFENQGITVYKEGTRLEMLNNINEGTVIITAHGVSDQVKDKINSLGLSIVDTTCPFVSNSIKLIKKYLNLDYTIIYIGSKNHPESETAVSFGEKVILISSIDEAKNLNIDTDKLIVTNQTTMSMYDIQDIIDCLKSKYPHLEAMEKVCSASIERQKMVMETAKQHQNNPTTAFIVIGDKFSHNTKKLADIISEYNSNVYLVESISDVLLKKVKQYETIYLASGTSTPNCIIEEIYTILNSDIDEEQYLSKLNIDDYVK